jgi:hypothetical protein
MLRTNTYCNGVYCWDYWLEIVGGLVMTLVKMAEEVTWLLDIENEQIWLDTIGFSGNRAK